MSSTGQGDQLDELSKDNDSEISSTTPDNSGEKSCVSVPTKTDSEAIPDSTFEPVIEGPGTPTAGDALNVASTTAECIKDVDAEPIIEDDAESIPGNDDKVSEDVLEPNKSQVNETKKMILAKADVNSDSLAEDFVLRWEKNYDDGMDETTPTDDVLRELDLAIQNIGPTDNANDDKSESIVNLESVAEKSELDNVGPDMQLDSNKKTGETVQDVKSPDSKNKECHVKVPPSDDPNKDEFDIEDILRKNEENSKILESDDVEMASSELLDEAVDSEKAMEISVTENMKKIEVDSTSIGETKETEKTMDFSDTENIKKVAVDPISIDKTKVEKTMDICDTENIERIVKDSTSIKETVKAEKTVNISVAENIEKFVVSGPLESLTRAISDQDIFTEKDSIAAIEKPCEKTVQVDAEKKPEPLPKDVEMDFDTEIVSEKSVVEDNQTKKDQIEVITKNINQDINEISKDIECPSNKDDDNQVKVAKINVDVAVTSDTHDSNTPSDNPIVSPIEVSQISNIVDPMNEIPSESPSKLELSEKDDAGDKRELVCEIKGKGDENISLVSIVDKSITPNIHHRINKPNVMLDIPTQELSDIEAELEDDDDLELYNEDRNRKTQEISCMEVDSDKIDEKTDIDLKESKDQKTLSDNINSKLETMDIDTLVDNGAPQVSISPTKSEIIPSKIQDLPSTKSLQADVDSSKTILESDTCEKLLTSTLDEKIIEKPSTIEIDYEKPLTSMLTDEIDNDKPSISESIQEIDDDKPSKTKQDDDQPLTSTREVDADIPSTSKSTEQTDDQNLDDDKSSKSVQEINEKPLTSNLTDGVNDEKSPTSKLKQEVVEIPSASKSSLKIDEEPSTSKLTDDIDGQKLTITKSLQDIDEKTSKSETHDQKPAASKSTQKVDDQSSTSKSTIQVADQKPEQEIDDQNSSTSKSIQDVDDQPSTSKSTQELNDQKLPSSKSTIVIDDQKPTLTQLTGEIDDQNPSSSQSTQEPDDQKPSSSQSTQELDDQKPSSSIQEMDDQQPSTSKSETLVADNDETEDVTDSLGLLAESSRVMDDDNDDDDDPDVDDNDEDDDFDPYEETNSEMAEDIDDSNTPPPDLDPKDKPDPSPKVQEERESDEGTMDIAEGSIDIVDDIDCEENDLSEMEIPDEITETPLTEIPEKEDEPEIIDADSHKEKIKFPPEKIINILEKVLGPHGVTGVSKETKGGTVRSYVELEGSSDSDDVQEISKPVDSNVVSVNIPMGVEVMSTSGPCSTSEIVSKEGEVIISGVPKPPPHKMSKINTSEVSIKTTGISTPSMHIPETIVIKSKTDKDEIFNLDSDDDDTEKKTTSPKMDEKIHEDSLPVEQDPLNLLEKKCINPNCSTESQTYYIADRVTAAYYSLTRRSAVVCEQCRIRASERSEALINGIKDLRPLLELQMDAPSQQLVEISDSDSEGEAGDDTSRIGDTDAMYLEEHLADMINETWEKYKMESRLKETESYLLDELEKIEADAKEINAMLDECQTKTDAVRLDFYKDYEPRRKSVGGIVIHDTPFSSYSHTEKDIEDAAAEVFGSRYPKRRATSAAVDTPAKRAAIPMGYTPLDGDKPIPQSENDQSKVEDDKEVSVVKLSAESAPPDLPPCGEIIRPSLKTGMIIYAMRNAFGTWLKGRIMEVQPKAPGQQFTQCRVKFEHKIKNPCKVLAARCLAYPDPSDVRMTIGTRVVALFKDPHNSSRRESFYSGVIAEIPNPVNGYRYLVFFDDGYAQYVQHQDTRVVCESSPLVWEEVHPFIRDFICNYLLSYPERPMVRLHAGEKLKTEWNGKWWESKVLQVDASIALIHFDEDNRTEWIYRGSTRLAPLYLELQAAEKAGEGRARSRAPRSKAQTRSNMPCVEYTRSDEQAAAKAAAETQALQQHNEEMRRQRAVAKKSTTSVNTQQPNVAATPLEGVISRVVYYTPKNAVKPYKMSTHICTVKCRRSDLLTLKDLRTYNPLAKPLLSGWEKQTIRHKGQKEVAYRAPCGRRLRNMTELHKYLRIIQSDLSVDLFDFTPGTHCLAEFVLNKCIVSKKDLSHGKENVPVPCVNYFDDSLPEFCSYNTERTPTAGVPLNLDPEFLCGCDCTDDCVDKSKCACWKMTLEGARTIGLEGPNVGYVYRRLPEPLPSGIYECNSRCKCKQTCLNRVAQHPLQLKLQVFKTINRGWGIRALNDVPKGSFLCVYAGNLLTDATANLDGINEGDEYLAELDYIEVVEGMKEGYEDDIPDADKKLDKKGDSSSGSDSTESEEEQDASNRDDDFQPGYIPQSNVLFKKSLRRREKAKKKEEEKLVQAPKKNDCITISDDEEVREPSRFTAQAGMVDRDLVSKQSSRVSVRTLFGKDEACYIMDAKVQGNIGRYLNHSCHPNVFVQNVFVDTHDPRFPWVAFFALSHVRAGTELTWNYNYDIGSVPEKVLYCYCGAPNCRGRLL